MSLARVKIAQVAPLCERVPPKRYGGTERVVSYLTEELVNQGHDVSLFASADSITAAKLVGCAPKATREFAPSIDPIIYQALQLNHLLEREFDIVHFHIECLGLPFARMLGQPTVTTMHGALGHLPELFTAFEYLPLVSISDAQRVPFPGMNWRKTVYHGVPANLYTFVETPGQYLLFIGRISPEKRCDRAIAIAKAAGMPLKIAAKVDVADREYFKAEISPLLDSSLIEFIGEVDEAEKNRLLGGALAMLFPIDWAEPFGLVMVESLACGTPVIAYPGGSVREIIEDGDTGFIVNDIAQAVQAVKNVANIDRSRCRQAFEKRFTASRMAGDYISIYRDLVENGRTIQKAKANGKAAT